jgi:hypothetical protein
MINCKGAKCPMPLHHRLKKSEDKQSTKFPYRELIGSLMYLATSTRPDIATAVNTLARFSENPTQECVNMAKQVLRYLSATKTEGLTFYKTMNTPLFGCVDSNWAREPKAKSRTGFALFRGGAACVWKTKVQSIVALSSTEAEYIALSSMVQHICWARELLNEIGWQGTDATLLQEDNQQAIKMCENQASHHRTLHIAVRNYFISDHIENKTVNIEWVNGKENPADSLTKCLEGQSFNRQKKELLGNADSTQHTLSRKLV